MGQKEPATEHFKRAEELIGMLSSDFLVGIKIRELQDKHNTLEFLKIT